MDVQQEISIDDRTILPGGLWEHADLRWVTESLGDRGHDRLVPEGGVSFGRLNATPVEPEQSLSDGDRLYALVRFPFDLDRLPDGRRYTRVDFHVELGDSDAVACGIWPVLVTDDQDAERARAFAVGPDLTLLSHTVLSSVAPIGPVLRYVDLQPSIVGAGIGMSRFSWTLAPTDAHSLLPSGRTVFALLDLPRAVATMVGTLSATVEIDSPRLGPFRRIVSNTRQVPFSLPLRRIPAADHDASESSVPTGPSVFISYAYDSDEHVRQVVELANLLARQGFDVIFDQWLDRRRQDWSSWVTAHVIKADFIIAVASPAYRNAGDGFGPPSANRGVQAETALMRELHYRDRREWTPRLLPVLLPGHGLDEIPIFLQPYTASHYPLTDLTMPGIKVLLNVLTGTSTLRRPAPDPVV